MTIAREFLVELGKIPAVENTVNALRSDRSVSPVDWAIVVHAELKRKGGNIKYLTDLASRYLSNLVVAFRNPGGKKTPQETIHPTPNLRRLEEIGALLRSATANRSQSALRDLIFLRDGNRCPITNFPFYGAPRTLTPRCAHTIPFPVHSKTHVHQAIETFTGRILRAEDVQHFINNPANAINIESNVHDPMDLKLAWGIEAREVDHRWHYYFRVVRPVLVSPTIPLDDGDEIQFGKGDAGSRIQLPDPRICNLHLAIARVFAASGAADVFGKYLEDDEDYMSQVSVYFGGPFVADDVLMRRLEVSVT